MRRWGRYLGSRWTIFHYYPPLFVLFVLAWMKSLPSPSFFVQNLLVNVVVVLQITCPEQGVCTSTSKVLIMCVPWKVQHDPSLPCNNPMSLQSKDFLTFPATYALLLQLLHWLLIGNWVMGILLTESLMSQSWEGKNWTDEKIFGLSLNVGGVLGGGCGQCSNSIHSIWSTEVVLTFLPSHSSTGLMHVVSFWP